jgi:hypothetical protein
MLTCFDPQKKPAQRAFLMVKSLIAMRLDVNADNHLENELREVRCGGG